MRVIALVSLAVLVVAAPHAAAEDAVLADSWAVMKMGGKAVGYTHTVSRRRGAMVETVSTTRMTMLRMGAEIKVDSTETSLERASDGGYVSIRTVATSPRNEQLTEVAFKDGKAHMKLTVMGSARESEIKCPDTAVGPYYLRELIKKTGLKPGATANAVTFSTDMGGAVEVTATVVGPEEAKLLDGTTRTLTRIDTVIKGMPMTVRAWWTKDHLEMKTSVRMAGLLIEGFLATKETALAAGKGGAELPPDVFNKTLIGSKHSVPSPRRLDTALLRVRVKKEVPDLADGRQVVEKRDDKTLMLRISRVAPPAERAAARPDAALSDSLEPNSMIQSDEAEIQEIAADVVGTETDTWKASQALERWVHKNVTEKNMSVGFASALEVCRNREGDCTEHAVLLAALGRAAGIPSRVVMGVVYFSGVWGGHAWNEVWVDGRWYQLDATQGRGSVDPMHLALARMTLKDGGFGTEFMRLLTNLGNLDIEVIEVSVRGRTVKLDDGSAVTIDADRYVNRGWGLALTRPDGWVFDPPRRSTPRMSNRILEIDGKSTHGKVCEIEIDATDAPPGLTPETLVEEIGDRFDDMKAVLIDGRVAIRGTRTRRGRKREAVIVVVDGTLFVFELDRVEGPAEVKAFDKVLASIDFDAK